MIKSQLNIKISKDLLSRVKKQAMMSGKSLTEHITDLVTKSVTENENQNYRLDSTQKIHALEERLLSVESIVRNREYLSPKNTPFNDVEAINCTKFMKGVFDKALEKRNFDSKIDAFDDFYKHIKLYGHLNESYLERLKGILISDNSLPWTGHELNELIGDDKCNCLIRKGLINWTGKINCPSQQEICDKGEELLSVI